MSRMEPYYPTTNSPPTGISSYPKGRQMSFDTQSLLRHGGSDRSGLRYELDHTSEHQQPDHIYAQHSRYSAPSSCSPLAPDLDDTNAWAELTCDQCGEKLHGK
jgi:hypothetical protein